MTDGRFDLSPLDPRPDQRFERMVGNITWRARSELARRAAQQRHSVVEFVAGWARPALLAAASVAGISLTLLATFDRSNTEVATGAYMSSAEVPAAALSWYEEDREPTVDDLLVVSSQGDGQ